MREIVLPVIGTVATWRREARRLAETGVPPEEVLWRVGHSSGDLFATVSVRSKYATQRKIRFKKSALDTIERALCHSDPERFARAYATILRVSEGRVRWGDRSDPSMARILAQAKAVARDIHKMHAFVRFRDVGEKNGRRAFAAWFEPEHPIVEAASPFFAKRFGDMDWVIATPEITARFQDGTLDFTETAGAVPPEDATEELWRTYYASIFNPARLMVSAMQSEMPKKYWKNLPEAHLIPELIRTAPARAEKMRVALPTEPPARRAAVARRMARRDDIPVPDNTLTALKEAAKGCRRCALHGPATQTVFGEGPEDAALMIVGEQPGDQEDLAGKPFVGPAGAVLDEAFAIAGLDRSQVYLTNAVKHFKFTPRGRRRIHQRPDAGEVRHCRWWLEAERRLLRPELIVAMGSTAAKALTGSGSRLLERRGAIEQAEDGTPVMVTIHPPYILRLPSPGDRSRAHDQLCADLKTARALSSVNLARSVPE